MSVNGHSLNMAVKIRRPMESSRRPPNLPLSPDNRALGGDKDFAATLPSQQNRIIMLFYCGPTCKKTVHRAGLRKKGIV